MSRYDLSDTYSQEEVLVYYSAGGLLLRLLTLIGSVCGFIYFYKLKNSFEVAMLFGLISLFFLFLLVKYCASFNQIQLVINKYGVQYRNEELVNWPNIENERVEIIKIEGQKGANSFFVYYIKNRDEVIRIDLADISILGEDLVNIFNFFRKKTHR